MLRLPGIDDVEQPRRPDPLDPVDDAGQVARGVGEGTGPAAHDQRQRLALAVGEPRRKHDLGAVGLLEQAGLVEPLDDLGHQRLVATLPRQVVVGQQHAELDVHLVPVGRALGDQRPPQRERLHVPVLQEHDPLPRPLAEVVVIGELGRRLLVERIQIADAEPLGATGADVDEVLDEHAERTAPVADVVLADDVVAEESEHADQRIADDGGAEVADVHLLGHIRRRVVDDDALGLGRPSPRPTGRRPRRPR